MTFSDEYCGKLVFADPWSMSAGRKITFQMHRDDLVERIKTKYGVLKKTAGKRSV